MNPPNPAKPTPSFVASLSRVKSYLEKQWLRCLLLAITGFVVRIPALQGQPIWDDDYLTKANPFIKSPLFVLEVFRHHLFPESYSAHYRPVQNISYIADYFLWNGNFYGFHLTSVLFHVAAGVLLYLLLRKLLTALVRRKAAPSVDLGRGDGYASWFAFFVALLWVVHPVHSAAIDYVSGRADSLGVFFGCSAWLLFLRARSCQWRSVRWSLFFAAWFVALLALCSRESACLWPFIFLLYLFAFERSMKSWQRWATVAACLLLFASYYGLRQLPAGRPVDGPSSGWSAELRDLAGALSAITDGSCSSPPISTWSARFLPAMRLAAKKDGKAPSNLNIYRSAASLFSPAFFGSVRAAAPASAPAFSARPGSSWPTCRRRIWLN